MLCVERKTLRGHTHRLCQLTDQLQQNTESNSSKKAKVCPSVQPMIPVQFCLEVHGIKHRIGNTSSQLSMHIWEVRCSFCYYHIQKQLSHPALHNFPHVWVTATMQPPFCFRWLLNSEQKHSLTLYVFSVGFLWRLTALAFNVDEELWKRKTEIEFPTGLQWNLCIFMISSPCPSLSNAEARQCFACLFTMKIHSLFWRRHLFLQKKGISPVSCSLTSACTAVTSIKWVLLFSCLWAGFWCPLQWDIPGAIYQDLNLSLIF